MKITFNCEFDVAITSSELPAIMKAFAKLLPLLLTDFTQKILLAFAEFYMGQKIKPFPCVCGNAEHFIWKTHHGKPTGILTIFMMVWLGQLQVQCQVCGKKQYLTRKLLGLEPRQRIPAETRRKLGLIGALTPFRVSEKIVSLFGWTLDKMTIWRAVQQTAQEVEFGLDPDGMPQGEADGTGIPIQGIKKRGKELKVFVQLKRGGGISIAGLSIGNYDQGWDKLFAPLLETLKSFTSFLLVTDGDTSILKGLGGKVKVLLQRCLWHIPHQLKYCLWQDKVLRQSEVWRKVLAEILDICAVPKLVEEELVAQLVRHKEQRLDQLIAFCRENGLLRSAVYLGNAKPHLFTALSNRLQGKTSSRVERVMRTVNLRINVGKWSMAGALNVNKIRLAYYYNGFDVV
jgi:hypothetical protein